VEEHHSARIAICLAWIDPWRSDASASDRHSVTANRNCRSRSQAGFRATANSNFVTQPRVTARDLLRCMRLALRAHLVEIRHPARWQRGCSKQLQIVAV